MSSTFLLMIPGRTIASIRNGRWLSTRCVNLGRIFPLSRFCTPNCDLRPDIRHHSVMRSRLPRRYSQQNLNLDFTSFRNSKMSRLCQGGLLITILMFSLPVCVTAQDCDTCTRVCTSCGEKVCCTYAKPDKEEKYCWEVECKEICIPAFRWPWEIWAAKNACIAGGSCDGVNCDGANCNSCNGACGPIKCGKVIVVRKLKKVTYECDTCQYEHRIECRDPNCGCHSCVPN